MDREKVSSSDTFGTGEYQSLLHLTDAKLHTEDGYTFDVHKVILARDSEYFRSMFSCYNNYRSAFWIPGISGGTLFEILTYLYTGKCTVTEVNLADLMIAADYLLINGISNLIKEDFKDKISIFNCLPIFFYTSLIKNTNICKIAFRFIEMHFETIVQNDGSMMSEFSLEIILNILNSKSLCTTDENSVWLTITKWVQNDFMKRQCYVPYLLQFLAWKDIDEVLANDIMNHEIVTQNIYCRFLDNYRNISNSNLDIYRLYNLQAKSKLRNESFTHRIPPKIYVIAKRITQFGRGIYCQIFLTYDGNLDLWHKIEELNFHPDSIVSIQHKIFLLQFSSKSCFTMNLKEKNISTLRNTWSCNFPICAIRIERYIYILGNEIAHFSLTSSIHQVEVYDFNADSWLKCRPVTVPFSNIRDVHATAISKSIYVVGTFSGLITIFSYVYDTVSQTALALPSPNIPFPMLRQFIGIFAFTAHKKKLYLIVGLPNDRRFVTTFDTITNVWIRIQDLPFHTASCAMVLNDTLYVCNETDDEETTTRTAYWNNDLERWEEFDGPNLELYLCCVLEDIGTIRSISKGNKYLYTELKKSDLCFTQKI